MAFAALKDREKVWELFSMIQPLSHTSDADAMQVYKTEPYVMAADVYANELHKGRGGWTWYTGSAGWMYQFITGSLLGMELATDRLLFNPAFRSTGLRCLSLINTVRLLIKLLFFKQVMCQVRGGNG